MQVPTLLFSSLVFFTSTAIAAVMYEDGPLYPEAELRKFPLTGITLGMPLGEAVANLRRQGFEHRFGRKKPIQSTDGFEQESSGVFFRPGKGRLDDNVELNYVKLGNGVPAVAAIYYSEFRSPEEMRGFQDVRPDKITKTFGTPSLKTTIDRYWQIWRYVSSEEYRRGDKASDVSSCARNWRCGATHRKQCRELLSSVKTSHYEIEIRSDVVAYHWADLGMMAKSAMRPTFGYSLDAEGRGECRIREIFRSIEN